MWTKILAGLTIFLPFQFAANVFSGADVAIFRIFVSLFFGMWVFSSFFKRKLILLPLGGFLWTVSACIVLFFAVFFAENFSWAVRKAVFLINFLFFYFCVASLVFQGRIRSESLVASIAFSGTFAALTGCLQWFLQFFLGIQKMLSLWGEFVSPFFLGEEFSDAVLEHSSWLVNLGGLTVFRAIGFFPDPHMFAFFLELCLPWAFFLFLKTKKKRYAAMTAVTLLGILLSFSRGAYIGLIVEIVGVVALVFRRRKISLLWKLSFGTFLIIFLGFLFGTNNFVRDRFYDTFLSVDSSGEERLVLWNHALGVIVQHPLFGVGLGGYPETVQPSAVYRDPIYVHNVYLDIAVEMGLLGLSVWGIGIFWAIFRFILLGKRDIVFYSGAIGIAGFLAHGMFDTPIYSVHIMGLVCVIIALIWTKNSVLQGRRGKYFKE